MAGSKTSTGNFTPVKSEAPRRLIWTSMGLEKCGKNHFGFTAPGPIFCQHFDPGGTEGMVEKFLKTPLGPKDIRVVQYRFNKTQQTQDDAKAIWQKFIDDYHFALKNARTIQWDETELWEVARFGEFARESGLGRDYGPLNGQYRGLVQEAYDAGVNLQLIQKVKEKWKDDKPTGTYKAVGFQQAANIVQINLEHSWDEDRGFVVKVINCRQNMSLAGAEFENITMPELAQLVFPESEEEEWV